jgi:hypothetical protein
VPVSEDKIEIIPNIIKVSPIKISHCFLLSFDKGLRVPYGNSFSIIDRLLEQKTSPKTQELGEVSEVPTRKA